MKNIEVKKCTTVTDTEGNRLVLYGNEAENLLAAMLDEFSHEELQEMRNRGHQVWKYRDDYEKKLVEGL